jgi:preprotein translocase subunit SecB
LNYIVFFSTPFTNQESNSLAGIDLQTKVAVNTDDDDKSRYQVSLEITALPEDEDKVVPYSVHLIAVGLFTVDENWDDPEKLMRVTGASILYSAAREFIITITSRGPWPPMILPSISFMSSQDKKETESEED